MNGPDGKPADPIDAAIAGAEEQKVQQLVQIPVTLGTTQRQIILAVPPDLQPVELMDFVSWLANPTNGLSALLARRSGPQLVVPPPGSVLVRPS